MKQEVVRPLVLLSLAASFLSCDDSSSSYSPSYSHSSNSSGAESAEELQASVDEFEAVQEKLSSMAFDDKQRMTYVRALDADLERMDYDFDGIGDEEKQARRHFREMLLHACRARGVSPPDSLSELGQPFLTEKSDIDWGRANKQLPEGTRAWIAKQGERVDPLREEYKRLSVTGRVAQKILDVAALRKSLKDKLSRTSETLDKFKSEMAQLQQEIVAEQTRSGAVTPEVALRIAVIRNDVELLRSKRAYVRYLTDTAVRLEAGTKDLLFIERQLRDEFRIKRLIGGEESRELLGKIDEVLKKYHHEYESLDRKLAVSTPESPIDILRDIQPVVSTQ